MNLGLGVMLVVSPETVRVGSDGVEIRGQWRRIFVLWNAIEQDDYALYNAGLRGGIPTPAVRTGRPLVHTRMLDVDVRKIVISPVDLAMLAWR